MNVCVDAGRGQDQMRTRNRIGSETELQTGRHTIHGLRIAGLADSTDESVLDADVSYDHSLYGMNDCDVGDDKVRRPGLARQPIVHAHAFAQALAAPEHNLVAKPAPQIPLDLHE